MKLGNGDKMRGFLSLFRNKFNKFNNTGAQMLDSIYHMMMISKILKNCIFGVKRQDFPYFTQHYNGCHYVS